MTEPTFPEHRVYCEGCGYEAPASVFEANHAGKHHAARLWRLMMAVLIVAASSTAVWLWSLTP